MLGQLPGGRILLATRRDVAWRSAPVRGPRSFRLPAPAMETDSSSSTSTWPGSLVAAASPVALSVYEDPDPGTWSSPARRSCSVTPWCASSPARAPGSRNNAGFIGRWRLRVTRASIRIGSRGILGMAARGLDDAVAARLEQAAERAHASAAVRGHGDVPVPCG